MKTLENSHVDCEKQMGEVKKEIDATLNFIKLSRLELKKEYKEHR